ncbi:MAG TPA: PAS domain S-box protein, partial [Spirochaetia bacterium]|nr:PAS domain S-box protein [Spirochaetia bacterium]
AGLLATIPAALGSIVIVGYLYHDPLLYDGGIIPVALTTAIGLMALGAALILEAGPESLPLRAFLGSSTRARMFRYFLPAGPIAFVADAALLSVLPVSSEAVRVTVFGLIVVLLITVGVFGAAGSVGRTIDETLRALTASEKELRAIFNGTREAILIADDAAAFVDANPAACYLFGLALDDIRRTDLHTLVPIGNKPREFWSQFLKLRRMVGTARLLVPDDTAREIEYSLTANILPGRHLIVIRDVTDAKKGIRESERLAAIVGSTVDAIYSKDLEGRIVSWNSAARKIFGYSAEEIIGKTEELFIPQVGSGQRSGATEGEQPPSEREVEAYRKGGDRLTLSISESLVWNESGISIGSSVIARDITAHREAERILAENQTRLRAFFDSKAVGILFGDIDGTIEDANDAFLEMIGYSRSDPETRSLRWTDLTPSRFVSADEQSISEARRFGSCRPYEKQFIRKDGTTFWVLLGFVLLEPDRRRSVSFIVDIDEKKHTEQALLRSEERFARMFESSPVAVAISGMQSGRIVDVNSQWLTFFGYTREEVIGKAAADLRVWTNPRDRADLVERLASGETVASTESEMRRKNGESRFALVSMTETTLASPDEGVIIVTLVDITERRNLESQLIQSQKMEAIGRLAGGVAHDFNNMLGVILGFAELMEKSIGDEHRRKIEQIIEAAKRAAGLTNQLLAFSRKQLLEPKVLNLNDLVAGISEMLRRLIGEDIHLETSLDPSLGRVAADPGQIEQVIMNLAVNSRDAMPEGGTLRIETGNAELDESMSPMHEPIVRGRYVMISVTDTGTGMDDETRSHLFEPFFTTKPQGKGTGLGLSTAYGIIKQSMGYVWTYTEVGVGTTFKVFLPRIETPSEESTLQPLAAGTGGSETILLAEDEPALRAMIEEVLTTQGYRVLVAENGNEAIRIAREYPTEIELLITDVIMPGMNGNDLATQLLRTMSGLKVLFISGYTADVSSMERLLKTDARFLSKPFTNAALLGQIRSIMDNTASDRGRP